MAEGKGGESYDDALAALGSLISGKKRPDGLNWSHAFESMFVHLDRLGLKERLPELSVIHVAGTKGKGSTCAMVERVLRSCGYRTGLFTSPHLCDVRERIRINGSPVDRDVFLRHFWAMFNTLKEKADGELAMPAYFRFLTMLGLHIFLEERVDVVVLEVGLGGRLDATNCVPPPVVCGVTPLGFDHMDLLGHTLALIAREKAGIFKLGSPAFTVPQPDDAMQSLVTRAGEVGTPLRVAPAFEGFRLQQPPQPLSDSSSSSNGIGGVGSGSGNGIDSDGSNGSSAVVGGAGGEPNAGLPMGDPYAIMGMQGAHQLINASLAVQLAAAWEGSPRGGSSPTASHPAEAAARAGSIAAGVLPPEYVEGLQRCRWPGRCETIPDPESAAGALTYFMDGAHTPESMEVAALWFSRACGATATAAAGGTQAPAAAAAAASGSGSGGEIGAGASPAAHPAAASSPPAALPPHRVLLFHCMEDRDPAALLMPLLQTLAEKGAAPAHALFVPPDSQYADLMKMGPEGELSWHRSLQRAYEAHLTAHPPSTASSTSASANATTTGGFPPLPLVAAVGGAQDPTRGAVLPSLRAALQWLRQCARQAPQRRVQVLVTGSLYLVGDMLRLLGRAP